MSRAFKRCTSRCWIVLRGACGSPRGIGRFDGLSIRGGRNAARGDDSGVESVQTVSPCAASFLPTKIYRPIKLYSTATG